MFFSILTITTAVLLIIYCALLLYFSQGFDRFKQGNSIDQPAVTVIVPAHNEADNLPSLLGRLSIQIYPEKLTEIVLVDDRSTDDTFEIMHTFAVEHPNVRIIHIREEEISPSPKKQAIIRAIADSTGEIILLTDADTLPPPDWITEMVKMYDKETGLVFGYAPFRTDGRYNTLFHRMLALENFSMGAIGAAAASMNCPVTSFGANFSYRRKLFEDLDGFGDSIRHLSGDDDLFLHRAQKHPFYRTRFSAAPGSIVFTNPPLNLRHFSRQRIRFASKHLAYPKPVVTVLAIIYLFYLCLVMNLIGCLFDSVFLIETLFFLAIKTVFELIFLYKAQKRLEKRNLLVYYPLVVIPHLLYVVFFPVLGQLFRKKW